MKKYIFILGFILCATVLSKSTIDQSLTIRHAIWAVITLALFFTVKGKVPRNKLVLFFVGYLVLAAISLLWAINPVFGLTEVAKIAMMLIFFCYACEVLTDHKDFFIKAISLLGLAVGVYCIVEIAHDGNARSCIGTMGNRNVWSSAQFLLLPICVYSVRKWKAIGIISSGVLVLNILLLNNRTSLLALMVCAVILLCYYRKWYILAGIGVVVTVSFILNPHILNTESMQARFGSWSATMKLTRENPFFGIGINNWGLEIPRYATFFIEEGVFETMVYQRPHNDPLWVMSETGVFGLICYMGIFSCGLYYAFKTKNILALCGLAGYLVIATFSFPKERAFHSMMLMAYLALACADNRFVRIFRTRSFSAHIALRGTVLIVLCLITTEFALCHNSEMHMRKMAIARDKKEWSEVLKQADSISWLRPMDLFTLPVTWYTGEAHYFLGDRQQAVIDSALAIRCNPNNIYVLDRMGSIFEGLGNDKAAVACYRRALIIRPDFEITVNKLNRLRAKL